MWTGELKFNEFSEYNYRLDAKIVCDPEKQKMKIEYYANRLTFKFAAEADSPPRPIAHLTNYNSIRDATGDQKSKTFDQSIFDLAIAEALKKAIEAEKALPKKQAEEKRRLDAEKLGGK